MSGVKSLRAMFEQKADTSPPDRGRSPGLSSSKSSDLFLHHKVAALFIRTTNTTCPPSRARLTRIFPADGTETPPPARPLSKIRTSFVAIEKDGRMGLRRDPSNDSNGSLSQRRLSSHTEGETSVSGLSDKTIATEDTSVGYKTNIVGSPIPESPRRPDVDKPANGASPRNLGALTDQPSHNPDKHVDIETPTPELLPGDPTHIPSQTTAANDTAPAKAPKTGAPKGSTKPAKKMPAQLAPPATITRAKTPTRSPITAKTPTTSAAASKLSAPKPQHDMSKKTPEQTATATPKSGAKPAGSNKKPAPVHVSPSSGTGFVKPKVKSPTKPVKLPASLMAPTAASVSKVRETPRETLSRASGNQGRPASRASAAGATAGAGAPPKTLRRQSSVINRARPSIGPPPKKPLQDHPITKKEKEIDESFLARMMRPTASSSSKLTEKAPVTPPRSRSARPSSGKKSSASRSPKRALSRPSASRAGSPFAKREAPIKQVAPKAAKVETAEAAVELAGQAEAPRTPEAKAPVTPEPIVEEEETAAASLELEAVIEQHAEELEPNALLAQQAAELSLQEGEAEEHELKTPDEFEELLADEKEDKAEAAAAPTGTTTEVKTETA
ncbi:hypothetical protein LY76DRAFT_367572 [Colletotrichum caudatum]|nr:hypothetical protein LY76DRAFT_367572 [Colletotrichum caudatum]